MSRQSYAGVGAVRCLQVEPGPSARRRVTWYLAATCSSLLLLAGCGQAKDTTAPKPSAVAPPVPVVSYNQSCNNTAMSQVAMTECVGSELAEVQRQLDAALSEQERGASKAQVDMVKVAQVKFEAYERAECPVAALGNIGGTIYPMMLGLCQLRLTVQRLQEVRQDALGVSGGR